MSTESPIFDRKTQNEFGVSFWLEDERVCMELAKLLQKDDGSWVFHGLENAYYSAEDLAKVSLKLFELNGK